MRFGLVGDVHAEDDYLRIALDRLARERVEGVLCVGDVADGRGDVNRCVDLLRARGVVTVRGNHDRWLVRHEARDEREATQIDALAWSTRSYLANLPTTARLDTPRGGLLLCHGFGADDMIFVDAVLRDAEGEDERRRERGRLLRLIPGDVSIVACGHSHRRGVRRLGRLTVINAGTLRDGDAPCFAVVDLDAGAVQFHDIDGERVYEGERLTLDGKPA